MPKAMLKEGIRELEKVDGRSGNDTIKLWESYKEQSILWRALALLQMPTTFLAICSVLVMYFTKDTVIEVPPVPQPGHYSANELPDSSFINVAQEIVNLVATYQPDGVERQFHAVKRYLWEPALSFVQEFGNDQIPKIKQIRKSQIFFIVPNLTTVERDDTTDTVVVSLSGQRHKYIAGEAVEVDNLNYTVEMFTIPRNTTNPYGIVAKKVKVKVDEDVPTTI